MEEGHSRGDVVGVGGGHGSELAVVDGVLLYSVDGGDVVEAVTIDVIVVVVRGGFPKVTGSQGGALGFELLRAKGGEGWVV